MSAWQITNEDESGEGAFFVEADTIEEAIRIHNQHEGQAKIIEISRLKWCSLVLVTGERGESLYFVRKGQIAIDDFRKKYAGEKP